MKATVRGRSSRPAENERPWVRFFLLAWFIYFSTEFLVPAAAHERKFCRTDNLPVVVIEKIQSNTNDNGDEDPNNDDVTFRLVKRYDASELGDVLETWTNASTRRGLLEADDYHSRPTRQLRRSGDGDDNHLFPSGVPALRILHANHTHDRYDDGDNASFYNGYMSDQNRSDLYLARECACFVNETYEHVFCPFDTNQCGQIINDHGERPVGAFYPETIFCYSKASERSNTNSQRIVWLLAVIVWANFLFAAIMTPKGRSCLSFIPSRLPFLKQRWNPTVADYLLRHRPEQAHRMIRTHVQFLRTQLHWDLERQIRRRERRRQRAERRGETGTTGTNNDDGADGTTRASTIELVTSAAGGGWGGGNNNNYLQFLSSPRPTSLVLKTRTYHRPTPTESRKGDHEDAGDDQDEGEQCAICFTDIEEADRVGALPCTHVFHVDCLKPWLARQNACPFCRKQNVAVERIDEENNDHGDDEDDEDKGDENNVAENDSSQQTDSTTDSDSTTADQPPTDDDDTQSVHE